MMFSTRGNKGKGQIRNVLLLAKKTTSLFTSLISNPYNSTLPSFGIKLELNSALNKYARNNTETNKKVTGTEIIIKTHSTQNYRPMVGNSLSTVCVPIKSFRTNTLEM